MFSSQNPNTASRPDQLQNHPKFITVHGTGAGGTPHNPRTMDHGSWIMASHQSTLQA